MSLVMRIVTGQLPQSLASFIVKLSENKYVILTIVMLFVFVVGMFMEATANVLLLTPIFSFRLLFHMDLIRFISVLFI